MNLQEALEFIKTTWRLSNGRIALGLIVTIFAGFTEGLSLFLLIPLLAIAIPGSQAEQGIPLIGDWLARTNPSLQSVLAVFLILVVLQALLSRAKTLFNLQTMQDVATKLRVDLFAAISFARWDALHDRRNSDLNHALTNDVDHVVGAISAMLAIFQAIFLLAIYLVLAFAISWKMAAFAALVGAGLFLVLYPIRRRAKKHGNALMEMYQEQNAAVLEFIGGIRLSKLFASELQQAKAYSGHVNRIRTAVIEFAAMSSWGTVFFQTGVAVMAVAFVWLAVDYLFLDFASLAVLLVVFARIAPRFLAIQENLQHFLTDAPAYRSYRSNAAHFAANSEEIAGEAKPAPRLREQIEIRELGMVFRNSSTPALSDVSLVIPAGSVVALIGPSGSGKSTLADLVTGLLTPSSGAIYIDTVALDDTNRRAWRTSVASVPQDPMLMHDTLANNLRLGNIDASDTEIWDVLKQANVDQLVRDLPDGLQTIAGDRGTRFSGGERQRFALARALLRRPQLLILDEATSALDWENQQLIVEAIRNLRGELTILTIAHRPSLVSFADHIVALDAGAIVEQGSFDDLAAHDGSALGRMVAGEGRISVS